MSEGFVYAMTNPDYPGVFKVGMTTNTPDDRARSLSSETGVLSPFEVFDAAYSPAVELHEKVMHVRLADTRVHPNKEFFRAPPEVITGQFDSLRNAVANSEWWAPLLSQTFQDKKAMVPPMSEDELLSMEARQRFRQAEALELREDGSCPLTTERAGLLHSNIRLPEIIGGGRHRKSLRTADPEEALMQITIILKCIAREVDDAINGEPNV
ncbi:hypothetical protein RPALISO_94 [Ruegeria phage RpAliso]|nr:hypothetical protein RPALISO_94 [Ruegeria phage RpAliso]